ncbi:FAD-binding domain-containing protein [Podospora aff. communis PSN243]|uniref:Delta(24)-sterol reductase n=1 Tax=Podospora aff. communis PSN243 TaxID=3040156 RepID=A0AAV9GX10_9PEZI|nr:FAD-binding domain-containing protein [Podospora aff. communis PSN243]
MDVHKQAVARIAAVARQYFQAGEPYRVFHGSTNSTRPRRSTGNVIDISALNNVLTVDTKTRTALVEPNVPMDRLVASTLQHGLIPPVVMEFPGITVGGGFAGTGGESSSFKHGFFDRAVSSVEMVLADGEVVNASPSGDYADLFHGAAGAVGSLGLVTMAELNLVEAKRYVRTTYHPKSSVKETIESIQQEAADTTYDYVDGILFSKDHGVVVTGEMTDEEPPPGGVQSFSHAADPWFYLHVRDRTRSATDPVVEFIPLAEYLFRYDRGGFWVGASAFEYFKFPFNWLTRWFLDDFLHTRMLYEALLSGRESSRYVVQDLALPYSRAEAFVDYTAEKFGIWPLWLCPILQTPPPTFHPRVSEAEGPQFLNVGLWGFGPRDQAAFVECNRNLERRLRDDFGGMKWLYAHTYYSEDEFWQAYGDKSRYNELRKKYKAMTLPSVYDKVKVDGEAYGRQQREEWGPWALSFWPLGGMWGIRKAIQSGQYLPRCPPWRKEGE